MHIFISPPRARPLRTRMRTMLFNLRKYMAEDRRAQFAEFFTSLRLPTVDF